MLKPAIIFIVVFAMLSGCRTKAPVAKEKEVVKIALTGLMECDSTTPKQRNFTIPIRILDNSLGYARVRCYPHFDAEDTSNMIAKIKCGEDLMAAEPDHRKYYDRPCCYAVIVKDSDGKDRIGFISCLVAKSLEEIKKDSLCDAEIKKLPPEDRDGHIKQLVFKGVYTGKDLYITNPYNCRSGHCITSCTLNGRNVPGDEYYRKYGSTIVVDNWNYLKVGDSVRLNISHRSFGTPKLLNPEVLIKK